jgi:hypothetical protein
MNLYSLSLLAFVGIFCNLYITIKHFAMPKHNVFVNLPKREIGKTDVVFEVFSDLEKFGTITISKGALEWWPSNAKKPYRMDWTRFDRAIREHYGYLD